MIKLFHDKECLTNWLPEVDCENVLSITCHEKDSKFHDKALLALYTH